MDFIKNNKTLEKQETLNNYKNMASKLQGVWAVKINTQIKKLEDEISEENNINIEKDIKSNNVNNIIIETYIKTNNSNNIIEKDIKSNNSNNIINIKQEKNNIKEENEEEEEDGDWIKVTYK